MKSESNKHKIQVLEMLEAPVIYSLTAITATVGMLVYGTTMVRSGSDGGLLAGLKPFFGVPYSMIIATILVAILAINRRGKLLVVLALGEILHLLIQFSPTGGRAFALGEYLGITVMIACLLATACIHYDLVEQP